MESCGPTTLAHNGPGLSCGDVVVRVISHILIGHSVHLRCGCGRPLFSFRKIVLPEIFVPHAGTQELATLAEGRKDVA